MAIKSLITNKAGAQMASAWDYFTRTGNATRELAIFIESLEYDNTFEALMIIDAYNTKIEEA